MQESTPLSPSTLRYRNEVERALREALPGKNLYQLAGEHAVTVTKNGKLNKGWAGLTIEKVAALQSGNRQGPDGADFELKSTSLVKTEEGWKPKETIRITQLTPEDLVTEQFETSALWTKLSRLIMVGLHHASPTQCEVIAIRSVDIDDPELVKEISAFWHEVRLSLCLGEFVDFPVRGTYHDLIQLRPTGDGKQWSTCPVTGERFPARAFYGTKRLIEKILKL